MPNYSSLGGELSEGSSFLDGTAIGLADNHRQSKVREAFEWIIDQFRDAPIRSTLVTIGLFVIGATAYTQIGSRFQQNNTQKAPYLSDNPNAQPYGKVESKTTTSTSPIPVTKPISSAEKKKLADFFDAPKSSHSSDSAPKDESKKRSKPLYSSLSKDEVVNLFDELNEKYPLPGYSTTMTEMEKVSLHKIFKDNIDTIDKLNNGKGWASYSLNKFGFYSQRDLDNMKGYYGFEEKKFQEKISRYWNGEEHFDPNNYYLDFFDMFWEELDGFVQEKEDMCGACGRYPDLDTATEASIPDSFDWRPFGAVTEVRDQGKCGAGYAFAVADNVASAWFVARHNHHLNVLSPQYLSSCDYYTYGCIGGWFSAVYPFIHEMGMFDEELYPYNSENGRSPWCKGESIDGRTPAATITSWTWFPDVTVEKIQLALIKNGPLVVGVSAKNLEFYESGIDQGNNCDDTLDHAMLLVGWGQNEDGQQYWIVKNSWGEDWGDRGYWYPKLDGNVCGIMNSVVTAFA
mmetsp:Transcript_35736/g.47156  ORF Transcript_35736/g.47156 Transcript_35736/m.47156 type:complete len:515 (-) Transcript_35736:385-1929(-)